ncbi:MAG: hypothetical protein RL757_2611 [Bacteroidota bacterium]|jgi:hypothetical protein
MQKTDIVLKGSFGVFKLMLIFFLVMLLQGSIKHKSFGYFLNNFISFFSSPWIWLCFIIAATIDYYDDCTIILDDEGITVSKLIGNRNFYSYNEISDIDYSFFESKFSNGCFTINLKGNNLQGNDTYRYAKHINQEQVMRVKEHLQVNKIKFKYSVNKIEQLI